jgi:hypothetical protein
MANKKDPSSSIKTSIAERFKHGRECGGFASALTALRAFTDSYGQVHSQSLIPF